MIADLINLERNQDEGLSRQLFFQIRHLIETGRLVTGMTLPASRILARDLNIGRNTVIAAYDQLVLEGYLQANGRRGTQVSEASHGFLAKETVPDFTSNDIREPRLSRQARRLMSVGRRDGPTPYTFQPGLPEVRSFPHDLWGRLLRRAARNVQGHSEFAGYAHYCGLPSLKRAVLDHVSSSRGVVADVDQVLILSSAQAALDLVARVLLDGGDAALHEEPGYAGMLAALKGVSADCHPISVDDEDAYGRLEERVPYEVMPRLIYATPSHQFPTSRVMSLKDRLSLLSYASGQEIFVLEDDYDSEFHFSGAPISCLQGLDRSNKVIYMGTFSKSLMPALHAGYLVVPKCLVEPMRRSLRNLGAVPGKIVQQALSDFLDEGYFRAHIREMTKLYQKRRDILVDCLEAHCDDHLRPVKPDGGIQLPAYFTERYLEHGGNDRNLVKRLADAGIEATALSSLYWSGRNPEKQGLLLGFAASNAEEIKQGVLRLARVLDAKTS